jgi:hypothetical protein
MQGTDPVSRVKTLWGLKFSPDTTEGNEDGRAWAFEDVFGTEEASTFVHGSVMTRFTSALEGGAFAWSGSSTSMGANAAAQASASMTAFMNSVMGMAGQDIPMDQAALASMMQVPHNPPCFLTPNRAKAMQQHQ